MHTVAKYLAKALQAQNVNQVFGLPGGDVLPLVNALKEEGIDFILVRHETSAAFMADALYKRTGKLSVCLATQGPGAANLLPGAIGALLERTPLLLLTGQMPDRIQKDYTHMVFDQNAAFSPLTLDSRCLQKENAADEIKKAIGKCWSKRRGPVHLVLPSDVLTLPIEAPPTLKDWSLEAPKPIEPLFLERAQSLLTAAKRPILLVGFERLDAKHQKALRTFHQAHPMPFISTYCAKGLISDNDKLCMGHMGLAPQIDQHHQNLIHESDLMMAVGLDPVELRPDWLHAWPNEKPLIYFGVSPSELIHSNQAQVLGHLPYILASLLEVQTDFQWPQPLLDAHLQNVATHFTEETFGPASAIKAMQAVLPKDTILTLDVGAHRITASNLWRCTKANTLLQSNGFSSMGYGLPAAIGARLAEPTTPVVALTGDMGLWMTMGELGVIQENQMDVIVCYFADESLSLIELKQIKTGYEPYGVRFKNPEVSMLAKSFGGEGHRVQNSKSLQEVLKHALAQGGLQLVEIQINPQPYQQQI